MTMSPIEDARIHHHGHCDHLRPGAKGRSLDGPRDLIAFKSPSANITCVISAIREQPPFAQCELAQKGLAATKGTLEAVRRARL